VLRSRHGAGLRVGLVTTQTRMISPKRELSSPIEVGGSLPTPLRAYSDQNIFRNERVLRTLLRREVKHAPSSKNYFTSIQTDLKPHMRKEVANWMLEICEEEQSAPQVFCLAINYLDRFLSVCNIRRNQLQLLASVCLLVSWKVREHSSITAQKLIEFTDFNVSLDDLLEWEFLLLSKLDWDLSAVIAPDFVEHILQRLLKLDIAWNIDITRKNSETLIYLCYSHSSLASYSPSLIAVSSILTTLRPTVESSLLPVRDTPSPSSTSSGSTTSSPTSGKSSDPLESIIEAVQKITLVEKQSVLSCMEKLEEIMRASLPPSPSVSDDEKSPVSSYSSVSRVLSSSPITSRTLFTDPDKDASVVTPTKLIEAAHSCAK